ncbi:MAG: cytochrome c oxidase subunit 4 [Ilumatobacteraceae bacterium]
MSASKGHHDMRVQWMLFLGVAVFIAILAIVYWFVSYEYAGTTMLALASGLSATFGGFLFIQDHRNPDSTDGPVAAASHHAEGEDPDHYLPTTSWWPLVIGIGMVLGLNGLILSWPYAVPGMAVLMFGIGGFVSDSRRRA